MTAFSIVRKGKFSKRGNGKDGPLPRPVRITGFWGVDGFMPTMVPREWVYTCSGIIGGPKFSVIESDGEIVATLDGGEISETFGTDGHTEAKEWLDDQIYELMIMQADVDAPLDCEIDIDDFMMSGQWVRS